MPVFSKASEAQIATLHPDLQLVLRLAIRHVDFTVVEGHRGKEAQNAAFEKGNSKVRWPNGNHNTLPSRAVDVNPYPQDWSSHPRQIERLCHVLGIIRGIAMLVGVKLRWGGDWDQDLDLRDESFRDYYHLELVE